MKKLFRGSIRDFSSEELILFSIAIHDFIYLLNSHIYTVSKISWISYVGKPCIKVVRPIIFILRNYEREGVESGKNCNQNFTCIYFLVIKNLQ